MKERRGEKGGKKRREGRLGRYLERKDFFRRLRIPVFRLKSIKVIHCSIALKKTSANSTDAPIIYIKSNKLN